MKRTAKSFWEGNATDGKGRLTTQSEVLDHQAYSFSARFEDESGKTGTNPEELIAAAHAGCFNMALSVALGKEGFTPDHLDTDASVYIEKKEEGFAITKIELDLKASIPTIKEDQFQEIAKGAKENCPVSKVLAGADITLKAKLV